MRVEPSLGLIPNLTEDRIPKEIQSRSSIDTGLRLAAERGSDVGSGMLYTCGYECNGDDAAFQI